MVNIAAALALLYPNAVPLVDYIVQDDGNCPYLAEWNLQSPKPTDTELTAASIEAERIARVPRSVTMRQARLALLNAGILNSVGAAINALPSPQKEVAQIEWEYSQEVHRDKALVQTLGPALGLTDAQIDSLFIAAAAL